MITAFKENLLLVFIITTFFSACTPKENLTKYAIKDSRVATNAKQSEDVAARPAADAATIMVRKEVPVLCYHQIRDWTGRDGKSAKDFIVPVKVFKAQLKILADSGYHTILPDQLYNYLSAGAPLPAKPFMLTYDDTDDDQYNMAEPEMKKYGFKGVYFIMTVSLNRPKYMTREQVKDLSDAGNMIESHTWDHHRFTSYKTTADWETQVEKPKKRIEEITEKPAEFFAYPYGLWNKEGIPELKKRGIKAAFQLSTKRDPEEPLYTIRRMIASGYWTAPGMYRSMTQTFHLND